MGLTHEQEPRVEGQEDELTGAPQAPPRRRRRLWMWCFLLTAALGTVGAALLTGTILGYVRSLPPIDALEYYDPPEVTHVFDRSGGLAIGEFRNSDIKRQVVSIDEIPQRLRDAFLAIEDNRFYEHVGVDPIGLARAVVVDIASMSFRQGASTISQQLARNILPEQVGFEKKLVRKIKEALLTFQIERRYSKDQILEFYLNHIGFSSNSFGVHAAASTYFGKPLGELTVAQCALLAGIPKAITTYNPFINPKRALDRRNLIIKRMHELGMIDDEATSASLAEPLGVVRRGSRGSSRYPHFVGGLESELTSYYGLSSKTIKEGGLRITSTLDPAIQDACAKAMREGLVQVERMWNEVNGERYYSEQEDWNGTLVPNQRKLMKIVRVLSDRIFVKIGSWQGEVPLPEEIPFYEPGNVLKEGGWVDVRVKSVKNGAKTFEGTFAQVLPVQGSMVVLDVHTGEILAMVGGTQGDYNRAIQGGRQVGSCFKPFFYAAAFDKGITPAGVIVDEPVQYSGDYRPQNYEKDFFGPTTLIAALEDSRNVVTIRLYEALGMKWGSRFVNRFDFLNQGMHWNVPPELAVCLGTLDCTPLEMAAAYQVLANLGVGVRPQYFRSAVDADGRVVVPLKHDEQQLLDPVAAYQTLYLLRQVVLGGTGQRPIGSKFASPPYPPVCGKTGTTNDCRDAWFCGFTPDLVIVVQVGFDRPWSMGPRMTGGRVAGPIWAQAFGDILKTRKDWTMTFDRPEGIELANICAVTGKRVSEVCELEDHRTFLYVPFKAGTAPSELCDGACSIPLIAPVGYEYSYLASLAPRTGIARVPDAQP